MRKSASFSLGLLAVFATIAIIGAIAFLLVVDHSRQDLKAYRSSLEKRGEKFKVADLMPPPAIEADNGARDLIAAARELNRVVKENEIRRLTTGRIIEQKPGFAEILHLRPTVRATAKPNAKTSSEEISWEEVVPNFAPISPLLEKIRQAARSPRLEFHPNYELGVSLSLDAEFQLLSAAQFLSQQSLFFLHEKNLPAAVDNTITLLLIEQMVQREPIFLSQLISQSVMRIAANATWEILQARDIAPADLSHLQAAWETIRPAASFPDTLRMERAMALPLFDSAEEMIKGATSSSSASSLSVEELQSALEFAIWSHAYRYSDERELMQNYQTLLDSVPTEGQSWRTFLKANEQIQAGLSDAGLSRLFSRSLFSSLNDTMERFAKTDTVKELCLTAIALRRYQLDHENSLPSSLAELVPPYLSTIPLDPMDGKPLRYHLGPDGAYSLYSVGTDGIDAKGSAAGPSSGKLPPDFANRLDIVWPVADKP